MQYILIMNKEMVLRRIETFDFVHYFRKHSMKLNIQMPNLQLFV